MSEILRAYRRNAVHVRQALSRLHTASGRVAVGQGFLRDPASIDRYKQLSIPVRRGLNPRDRASVAQALEAVGEPARRADARFRAAAERWRALHQELDGEVGLGGTRVPRRDIVTAWLEAAAFYDKLEREHAYDRVLERWGPAAESIGVQLTEDAAAIILLLDEAIADALDEPVILPPPERTPPPAARTSWWRKLWRSG